jgi:hypothetical protein
MIALRDKARTAKSGNKQDEAMQVLNAEYLPAMASYIGAQKELVKMQEQRVADVQAGTENRRMANTFGIMAGLV